MSELEGPDGHIFEFEDGTPQDVISRVVREHYARQPQPQPQPRRRNTDIAGASATYAHGATIGTADEIAGAFGGAAEAVQSFIDPERGTRPRGGQLTPYQPRSMADVQRDVDRSPITSGFREIDLSQSVAGRLIDQYAQTGRPIPAPRPREPVAPVRRRPTVTDRVVAAGQGAVRGYNDTTERFRDDMEQFREDRPNVALGTEIVGGLASPANVLRLGRIGATAPIIGGTGAREAARVGALYGAGYTVATGEDWDPSSETSRINPERLATNTALSAGGGVALQQGVRAVGGVASRFNLNPAQRATRLIDRGLRDANMTPAELARRARALRSQGGQTRETIAEVGEQPLQRQARAVANVRGPGQQIAQDVLEARSQSITPRVLDEATRPTRPRQTRAPRNFYDAREQLRIARSGQASEAYRIAHATDVDQGVVQQELLPLMQRGPRTAVQSAISQLESSALRSQSELAIARRANDAAAIQRATGDLAGIEDAIAQLRHVEAMPSAGERLTQAREQLRQLMPDQVTQAARLRAQIAELEPLTRAPPRMGIRALDYYQRGLRQLAESAGQRSPEGSAMEQARQTFNRFLDEVAPAFGEARQNFGASVRIEELMVEGRRVFTMPDGEIDLLLRGPQGRGLSTEEFDGFMLGVLDAIETKVRSGDTQFIARFMRNENWQRQLERALGRPGARRLRNRIAREARMRGFDNAVRSGARTTPMAEDIRSLTEGEDELGFLSEIIQAGGNVRGPVLRAAANAYDRVRRPGIYNENVNRELAQRLYQRATPGNIAALQAEIAALPQYALSGVIDELTRMGIPGLTVALQDEPPANRTRRLGRVDFAE